MAAKNIIQSLVLFFLMCFGCMCGIYGHYYFSQETETLNELTRNDLDGKFIRLSDGFVHYELAGPDSGHPIIMIHGAGSGYYAWDKNFQPLASKGFRVLRYDLYGRGYSDRPSLVYDPDLFERQLSELIDSLKIEKPYTLLSVSMGAIVSIKHIVLHPASVKNMVMVDPAALNDPDKPLSLRIPIVSDILMTAYWYPRAIQKQMREFYQPDKVADYALASAPQMKYKGFKSAMKSTWLNTLNKNTSEELKQIGRLHVNTLLLWGKYDPLISPVVSKNYKEYIPQTVYYEIDSAGHLANYERPHKVNKLIISFLHDNK